MPVSQEQRQVRELIARGQSKGFLTNDEVNRVLPPGFMPHRMYSLPLTGLTCLLNGTAAGFFQVQTLFGSNPFCSIADHR